MGRSWGGSLWVCEEVPPQGWEPKALVCPITGSPQASCTTSLASSLQWGRWILMSLYNTAAVRTKCNHGFESALKQSQAKRTENDVIIKTLVADFPGCPVVKNASAGDTNSISGPGRFHMLQSNWSLHALQPVLCNESTHRGEKLGMLQLEKACTQQQRPSTVKNKINKIFKKGSENFKKQNFTIQPSPEWSHHNKGGLEVKTKITTPSPITSWQIDGEKREVVTDFIFLGLQNHCRWWPEPWS